MPHREAGSGREAGRHREAGPHPEADSADQADGPVERVAEEIVEAVDTAVDRVLPPHLRLRAWARRRRSTHVLWRASILVLGGVLVVAGLVMLVIPGPGWAAIILGLVVLASEFAWAHRLLDPVRRWAERAARAALDPRVRRRNLILLAIAVVVVGAAIAWYVVTFGVTLDPITALLPW